MSKLSPTFAIRRILVAMDASPYSLAALNAAVDLAVRMDAELSGLFVEDTALLRLAEIPCTREVLYFSAAEAHLTRASMESRLRAQSEQVRKALEAAAQHAQVAWSFRTVRGEVASEVLAAAKGVDLLALGKGGWALDRRLRTGSTALELAASSLPVLLLPEHGVPENAHLLVYYDGSPAAQRGLLAALQLEAAGMDGITLLLDTAGRGNGVLLQNEIDELTQRRAKNLRYRQIDANDEADLLRALKAEESGLLVLGSRELLKKLPSLDLLLRETDIPFLLLANE